MSPRLLEYWDVVAAARENYRNDVETYFLETRRHFKSDGGVRYGRSLIDQIDMGIDLIQVWN
jgi:hypothetical protein